MFSMQFAKFIFHIAADIRSVTTGMKLWDLTFRIDRSHVFGTLQFETLDRHEKIQMQAHFYTTSLISINPLTHEATFYRELESDTPLGDYAVSEYMRQINGSLRCDQSLTFCVYHTQSSSRELTEEGQIYLWQSRPIPT